ncbi:cytoplasmic protein [candidate division WOR_3 bacterium SM23_42]|uniref:Cytoplasmic protein n=1 Tax=candidate division WOR_3 bacterium SM23_42 TaxID=1703779 RepID=A0A0S8FRQ3_UNCW3|nr:MAG: cytoplasmic protein [candidate division WOR_3 bacterium SM23_42]
MSDFVKPWVVISKCLGFARCRWNGLTIQDEFVERLKPHVEFMPVCAEVEIGLGVPRDPIRVILSNEELRLVQPATKTDVTNKMRKFCNTFLTSLDEVDGFILKSRSPSCGIKEAKIYPTMEKSAAIRKGSGFFGTAVLERFPNLPVEDEGRLRNFIIREHFLKRIFTIARFRSTKKTQKMKNLVQFQAENKFLFMAYNQKEFRVMGRIVANHEKRSVSEVYDNYEVHLYAALAKTPRYTSYINVFMHAMGHFSDKLNKQEKSFFLELMEKYRSGKAPLRSDTDVLMSWGVRFGEKYLLDQTFFNPYPEELLDISDSGKGRDY